MIFAAWCACCVMSVAAQDCEISLTIAKAAQKRGTSIPGTRDFRKSFSCGSGRSGECCQFQFYTILYHS